MTINDNLSQKTNVFTLFLFLFSPSYLESLRLRVAFVHFVCIIACVRTFGRFALVHQCDNDSLVTALGQLVDGLLFLEFALIVQESGLLHDALGEALQFRECNLAF